MFRLGPSADISPQVALIRGVRIDLLLAVVKDHPDHCPGAVDSPRQPCSSARVGIKRRYEATKLRYLDIAKGKQVLTPWRALKKGRHFSDTHKKTGVTLAAHFFIA